MISEGFAYTPSWEQKEEHALEKTESSECVGFIHTCVFTECGHVVLNGYFNSFA